jgi:hypothetical protein
MRNNTLEMFLTDFRKTFENLNEAKRYEWSIRFDNKIEVR